MSNPPDGPESVKPGDETPEEPPKLQSTNPENPYLPTPDGEIRFERPDEGDETADPKTFLAFLESTQRGAKLFDQFDQSVSESDPALQDLADMCACAKLLLRTAALADDAGRVNRALAILAKCSYFLGKSRGS